MVYDCNLNIIVMMFITIPFQKKTQTSTSEYHRQLNCDFDDDVKLLCIM